MRFPAVTEERRETMLDLLIEGTVIVTMDPKGTVINNGYVAIAEGQIVEMGDRDSLEGREARMRIDGRGKALLPGLIDCHCHAGHSFTRGSGIVDDWLEVSEDIYYRCTTPEFWYAEARLAAAEKIRFGTTTSVNIIGGNPPIFDPEIIDAHFEGAQSLGGRTISGIGAPNGPWPKTGRIWRGDGFTEKTVTFRDAYGITGDTVRKWHNSNRGRTNAVVVVSHLGPDKSLSEEESVEQIKKMREIANRYGVLLHGHAYRGDIAFVEERCPEGLGRDVFIAHCTGITPEEVKILARTGTTVVTGPSTKSHVRARCPVTELLEAGARVVIATDGNAPDRTFDLWKDLRIGQLLHRNFFNDTSLLPARKVLEMVTIDAAAALGMEDTIGSVEAGKRADLILVDVEQPHLYPFFSPVEQLVNAASGQDVDTVLVDGEIVLEKGELTRGSMRQILMEGDREFRAALDRGDYKAEEFFGRGKA